MEGLEGRERGFCLSFLTSHTKVIPDSPYSTLIYLFSLQIASVLVIKISLPTMCYAEGPMCKYYDFIMATFHSPRVDKASGELNVTTIKSHISCTYVILPNNLAIDFQTLCSLFLLCDVHSVFCLP